MQTWHGLCYFYKFVLKTSFLGFSMRHVRLKFTALLFVASYLLICFSAMAANCCHEMRSQQCPLDLMLGGGCDAEIIEATATQGQSCGACFDHCDPNDHPDFHAISAPAVKRVSQPSLIVATISPTLSGFLATWHFTPASQKQINLPNSALAALRTVVLLN
jgi:hypothetical protein